MKIHILKCGYIRIAKDLLYSGKGFLADMQKAVAAPDSKRETLPVCTYLIEHPKGLFLVDTGWSRDISPDGIYDPKSVRKELPAHLAAMYRPYVPAGMAVNEQLEAMGIRPEDLEAVLITHLDADNVSGLKAVCRAKRIIVPEDEAYWSVRTKYRIRQSEKLWDFDRVERVFFRGHLLGPLHKAIDVVGDGSIMMVGLPGHTDGNTGVIVRSGERFVLLAGDAGVSQKTIREMKPAGLAADYKLQYRTLKWISETADDPGCAGVLFSHEYDETNSVISI